MNDVDHNDSVEKTYLSRPVFGVLAIVIAVVALLIVINRSEHLQLRPASGAANAISQAATVPSADTARR